MNENEFKSKYLKYKSKYYNYKNIRSILEGGVKPEEASKSQEASSALVEAPAASAETPAAPAASAESQKTSSASAESQEAVEASVEAQEAAPESQKTSSAESQKTSSASAETPAAPAAQAESQEATEQKPEQAPATEQKPATATEQKPATATEQKPAPATEATEQKPAPATEASATEARYEAAWRFGENRKKNWDRLKNLKEIQDKMNKLNNNEEKVGLYWEFLTIIHTLDKDYIKKYHAERKNLYNDNNKNANIDKIFNLMDKDKNGEISKEEIIYYFTKGPQKLENYKIMEHINWTIEEINKEQENLVKTTGGNLSIEQQIYLAMKADKII